MSQAKTNKMLKRYRRGLLTTVRSNGSAYGYSVTITAAYGVLSRTNGAATVFEIFLFALGPVIGFIVVDGLLSFGLRRRERGEPSEVVALGAAMGLFSVGCGIGMATLSGLIIDDSLAWLVGSLLATLVYLLLAGLEMTLAQRLEETLDE